MALLLRVVLTAVVVTAAISAPGCAGWCNLDSDCARQERCDWDRRCVPQDYSWPGDWDGGSWYGTSTSSSSSSSGGGVPDAGSMDCGSATTPVFDPASVYVVGQRSSGPIAVAAAEDLPHSAAGLPSGTGMLAQISPWDGNLVFLSNGLLLRFRADPRTYRDWYGCILAGDPVINDEEIPVPQCAGSQNRVASFRVLPDEDALVFSCGAHNLEYQDLSGAAVQTGGKYLLRMGANRLALVQESSYSHGLSLVSRTGTVVPVTGLPTNSEGYTLVDARADGDGFRLALGFQYGKEQWQVKPSGAASRTGIYAETPRGVSTGDNFGKLDSQGRLYTEASESGSYTTVLVRYELTPGTAQVLRQPDGGAMDIQAFFSGP